MSGPESRPVNAWRSGWNSALPLRPVAALSAPVRAFSAAALSWAPALMAARSRLRSKPLRAAAIARKAIGIDSRLWAMIMPAWVPVSRTRLTSSESDVVTPSSESPGMGLPNGEVADHLPGEFVSVYVPTTPNPTSGFFLMMPRADVVALKMSVDEALKYVISMGVVSPPGRPVAPQALPAAARN